MKRLAILACLLAGMLFMPWLSAQTDGFTTITDARWNEKAVRKVLQAFAFGGFASDAQIHLWADMAPDAAIQEILTFEPVNGKLSPAEDASVIYAASLEGLQTFWSGDWGANPVRPDKRDQFAFLRTRDDGSTYLYAEGLKRTWVQAATTRGVNPFLYKLGLYLTNYHMAIRINKTRTALMRHFYDETLDALARSARGEMNFFAVLARGASSAAVAKAYRHQYNTFNNRTGKFNGNDDFAREFHQLFFKINGITEPSQDYHENVNIEHTAWLLTGMRLDTEPNAFGSTTPQDWQIYPIDFTDHVDASGRNIYNLRNHHAACLEIYNSTNPGVANVCGATAKEKLENLAQIAGYHAESLDNLPVAIIDFLADDNLTDAKKAVIRAAWRNQEPKDLLAFLRAYAISTTFHRHDTYKYRNAFDRNLLVRNLNNLDNVENFARFQLPHQQMKQEGADVFYPAHDVFGGQTGLQAANNPNIFKSAFSTNIRNPDILGAVSATYPAADGSTLTWEKNWARLVPKAHGTYEVKHVAKWLWNRFMADANRHFDIQARLQVYALLATGQDFGYQASLAYPDRYTRTQPFPSALFDPDDPAFDPVLYDLYHTNKHALLALDDPDPAVRLEANRRMGLAVNFITATPYIFAMEGK